MSPEPSITTAEPILARARRVAQRLAARSATAPQLTGREVTPEAIEEEAARELVVLADEAARERDAAVALREAELATSLLRIQQLESTLSRTNAALRDALAKATQVGPVTGDRETWEKRLAAMPPLQRHEIESWRERALRVLVTLGTTQDAVMIARLADLSLEPYQQTTQADAATS